MSKVTAPLLSPAGRVEIIFRFKCAVCRGVFELTYPSASRGFWVAAREAKAAGWRHDRQRGWVCGAHKQIQPDLPPAA